MNVLNKDELEIKLNYCKEKLKQFTDRHNEMIRVAQEEAKHLKPPHNVKNESTTLTYWAGFEIGMLNGKIILLEDILYELKNKEN
jgi:hypothetical protein